ncbi:hypothetical protein NIES2109_60470 (plasmid) [Nostoc sp. HK-01]|nr:hypothetical protein NIES2109_60470 [Nostoc sp. HK-01]
MTISKSLTPIAFPLRLAVGIAQKLLDKIDLRLSYMGRLGPRGNRESVYQFVASDDGRDSIFKKWLNRELVSVTSNIDLITLITDTTSLPSNQDMGGQENLSDSWWEQVKSYAAGFMERVKDGVGAVKEFLSTFTLDER